MRHLFVRVVLASGVVAGSVGCGGEAPSGSEAATGGAVISAAEAAKTYALKCGMCHGEDGKLMLAGAPDLSTSTLSREDRIALITYGKGTMPPQQGVLDDAAIAAVADHLETLRR
jgi:mono/diheme cytochrome c family protein